MNCGGIDVEAALDIVHCQSTGFEFSDLALVHAAQLHELRLEKSH